MERLEKAADLLMASPEQVTNQQRHEAEQVFMHLRQTKAPFNLCREILETSQVPYLLFEAASLLRVAIIREWRELSAEDRLQLRQYIIQYVMTRPHMLHYVRETLVQVVAIMVKRGSVEDGGEERSKLITEVERFIQDPDNSVRVIGCSVVSALMQEYAVTVKSTDVGITWETHFMAKKQFEGTDLKRIFSLVVRLLQEGVEAGGGAEGGGGGKLGGGQEELRSLLLRMLVLAESTLTWTFISLHLPKRLMSVFEQDQNPSLRPGPQWEEVFKDTSLLHLFFKAYWLVRSDWELGHHALNCLVQLASLNGVALINKESRIHYLTSYLTCFFSLLSSVEVQECEALGFSHIFRKLLQFFPPPILVGLPYDLLNSLVDHLTALTCQFAQRASAEEHADQEDQVYMEAFEQVLHSWTCILQEASSCSSSYTISGGTSLSSVIRNFTESVAAARAQHDANLRGPMIQGARGAESSRPPDNNNTNNMASLKGKIKEGATLIFDTYLKCHLAPPDGTRQQLDANEISETALNDRQLYKDQLQLLGLSARQNVEHCIPVLTELMEQRTSLLRTYLAQALHNPGHRNTEALDNLYEDLHWLVLIICHVVTTDNDSEASLIPSELLQYSIKCAATVDVTATLALLAAPHSMPADMNAPPAMQPNPTIDPLIRIMAAVLRLCQTETEALKANMRELLSPELSCTLIWFLKRFCLSYLLPNESFYPELSVALSSAFGRDSEGAAWALEFLLSCVERTLRHRTAEPALVEDTIALLSAMADHRERGQLLVKSKSLVEVVQLQQSGQLASLSSSASRGLMQGLVLLAGSVAHDSSTREEVWQHVLDPLIRAFHSLLDHADFTANYQMDNYRKQMLHHMDNFAGAMQGCLMGTAASLFDRLSPSMAATVRLLDLYHNYPEMVEAIMEVYVECGRRLLCYLSPSASKQLYEGTVQLVRVYAKHNIGRRTVASEGEQDQWRDLQLLMELLTSLLSKDFIDLAPNRPDGEEEEVVAAADVALYGLNIIMPLMSRELLQIPTLCSHYYKMVTFIAEIYPSKIGDLPPDLIKNLLSSIELGLTEFGPDVSSFCFDFLFVLTTHVFKHKSPESDIRRALQPFLKLVLDLILSQQVNSDLLQAASASLYILICSFQSEYRSLVGQLLATQADPATRDRLALAFTTLTENVELTAERAHKFKFRNNFEEFIANVRGFLFVK